MKKPYTSHKRRGKRETDIMLVSRAEAFFLLSCSHHRDGNIFQHVSLKMHSAKTLSTLLPPWFLIILFLLTFHLHTFNHERVLSGHYSLWLLLLAVPLSFSLMLLFSKMYLTEKGGRERDSSHCHHIFTPFHVCIFLFSTYCASVSFH